MTDTDDANVTPAEGAIPGDVVDAFERHPAFARDGDTRDGDAFALDSTAFDVTATARPTDDEKAAAFSVHVPVPTLSATVADPDDVAPVVEDGWFETLERRLEDAFDVAKTSYGDEPVVERDADTVEVTLSYESWDANEGVEDAKVLAEYVEGTYVQGLIPGYDYVGVAAELRSRATQNAGGTDGSGEDEDGSTGNRSGTPL